MAPAAISPPASTTPFAAPAATDGPLARLTGLNVVITGAGSGIGRTMALAFAAEGTNKIVCADLRTEPPPRDDATKEDKIATDQLINLRYGEGKAVFYRCDVSQETTGENGVDKPYGMQEMIEKAAEVLGRIDVMVNCAGVGVFGKHIHETDISVWQKNVAVNSTGPFLGIKHSVAHMLKNAPDAHGARGSIINISTIGYMRGLPDCGAYCASKAALVGASRVAAVEYAPQGIRCNVLVPGFIMAPMLQQTLDAQPGFQDILENQAIPLGRIGKPSDVAAAAIWLASARDSGYITGVALPVDGGVTAK